MTPYERLLGDAMRGDLGLFGRQDAIEAQWAVVDPVLGDRTPVYDYPCGTWGPREAARLRRGRRRLDRSAPLIEITEQPRNAAQRSWAGVIGGGARRISVCGRGGATWGCATCGCENCGAGKGAAMGGGGGGANGCGPCFWTCG